MFDYRRKPTPVSVSHRVTTPPSYQLITVAEARQHLRLEAHGAEDDAAEDAYLTDLIAAAGDTIEIHTRRPIRDQQRELVIERESTEREGYDGGYGGVWPGFLWGSDGAIVLNTTPIRSVDAITYMEDGVRRTVADTARRVVGLGEGIQRDVEIFPAEDESWPWYSAHCDWDTDIRISVTCGYTQANLPPAMKHACRLMINDWYSHRGQTLVGTISATVGRSLDYLLAQHTREVFE